jgi:hypothetical protein
MPYKDQIIHITGGVNDYIGELDPAKHKLGPNWYRINDPCLVFADEKGMRLAAIQGTGNFYKRFVDIRIPEDSIIEIRTLDAGGDLMEAYEKERVREKSKLIQMANAGLKLN